MSTSSVIQSLQTIHRAISGVTSAPDGTNTYPIPSSIANADLPIVLLFPATVALSPLTQDTADDWDEYEGIVLIASEAQGIGITDTVTSVWSIFDAFKARYKTMLATDERIDGNSALVMGYQTQGQKTIEFRGVKWEGFIFRLRVWSIS